MTAAVEARRGAAAAEAATGAVKAVRRRKVGKGSIERGIARREKEDKEDGNRGEDEDKQKVSNFTVY